MSGQPYKYAKDVENFRNEYMESLGLRANLDNMNLQANKTYKETGALPPQSSMKDNRTTAEILADTERLKLNIIGEFKGLATPNMIMMLIQRVQSSPYNGDGSFFTWLAQNTPELVTQLKKKYKYGIEGDANDVEQMYLFLQTTYARSKDLNQSVKSAFDRPTHNDSVSMGDFGKLKKYYDDILFRLLSAPEYTRLKSQIRNKMDLIDSIFSPVPPTNVSKYDKVKEIFTSTSSGRSYNQQIQINLLGYNDVIEYTDKLPSVSSLKTLLEQLEKTIKNNNHDLSLKILSNIDSVLPSMTETQRVDDIIINIINTNGQTAQTPPNIPPNITNPQLNPVSGTPNTPPTVAQPAPVTNQQQARQNIIMKRYLTRVATFLNDVKNTPQLVQLYTRTSSNTAPTQSTQNELYQYCYSELVNLEQVFDGSLPAWRNTINYNLLDMISALEIATGGFNLNLVMGNTFDYDNLASAVRQISTNSGTMVGAGIGRVGRPKGSGIVKPLSERIDRTKGIKQGHTHVPFGKYLLNRNRLDENIVSFKHDKGYGVKGYPAKRVSKNLSNILKTIVGGGVPQFDDLNSLTNEEKTYLHAVSKKSGITDKISVPTPSKDSMDQDIHSFNVMKGEILAGNDSSMLIKKFKLLLLKLSKNGTLPKKEASEIMEDLIQLGY
jgi:hypothetical protein